jgi:hypothetical protein
MARTDTAPYIGQSGLSMLGIYLNDHLAVATAGTELAHRMARSRGDGKDGGTLRGLAAEIAQDRAALLDIMAALGIKVRRYKVGAAWIDEKAGRLKFNGRLFARSPLSDLEEPEMLRVGVEGKAAGLAHPADPGEDRHATGPRPPGRAHLPGPAAGRLSRGPPDRCRPPGNQGTLGLAALQPWPWPRPSKPQMAG